MTTTHLRAVPPPSVKLFGLEPIRAALEYASMRRMNRQQLPRGDGHPIVVFPGLASDGKTMATLRDFLRDLGYTVYDWGRGFNSGPKGDTAEWLRELALDIQQMVSAHSEGVTLLGWSLGGIYAREVSKHIRPAVRQVITIGSPFAAEPEQVRVGLLWRWVNGRPMQLDDALRTQLQTAPDVPTTSIYSRTDGVVAWQTCIQPGEHPHVEHVEVEASHCGMCWNPSVLQVVAERLHRQPKRVEKEHPMISKSIRNRFLAAAALCAFGAAFAQGPLPAVKRSGTVEYLSGGIGSDESTAIKAASAHWPLTLEFAVNTQPRADYASDVQVTIRDAHDAAVFKATSGGPFLLVKLPPGRYSVDAMYGGKTLRQPVTVAQGAAAHETFVFPAQAG